MKHLLSRAEIAAELSRNGFVRDRQTRAHAEGWTRPLGERIHLKMGARFPLVIDPAYERHFPRLLAVSGVVGSPDRYAHNSNFAGFPKREHTGKKPIVYGLDFSFMSARAVEQFLDVLSGR